MREILFRGKRTDTGGWIWGFHIETCNCHFIFDIKESYRMPDDPDIEKSFFEVMPETVGQYTGLRDAHGNRIFEGHVVKLDDVICPITFSDGSFHMITTENQGRSPATQDRLKHFEIIGNITDNKELLK